LAFNVSCDLILLLYSSPPDGDQAAVATQTSRPTSPDISDHTLSKSDSLVNAENTSALVDNLEELTMASNRSDEPKERYKKSLRLSSAAIVSPEKQSVHQQEI